MRCAAYNNTFGNDFPKNIYPMFITTLTIDRII